MGAMSRDRQPIHRALDPGRPAVEDVRVDHDGAHVAVTEQLLDRPDVVAVFKQVGRERVAERVAGGAFWDGLLWRASRTARWRTDSCR
jgi:hypothetical protein